MFARRMNPRVTVSVVFVVAMFMAVMDTTIVNVALPTISRDLSVPLDRVDGVVTGFLVSLAVFIPASGWLGDRFGTKRMFLAALVIFTVAQLAVAWVLANPAVQVAIVGSWTPAHLEESIGALNLGLGQDDLEEIDSIMSAAVPVGGPAPEGMT